MGCASSRSPPENMPENTADTAKQAAVSEHGTGLATRSPTAVKDMFPRVVALYDYVARTDRELTFRAGDLLICTFLRVRAAPMRAVFIHPVLRGVVARSH